MSGRTDPLAGGEQIPLARFSHVDHAAPVAYTEKE